MVEIYADVVFIINFVMDFFIFWIVGLLARKNAKFWRLLVGAFVAALLYCVLIFAPAIRDYYNFFSSLIVLMSGIVIAFGIKDFKDFLKLIALSHIAAFAVGGLGMAMFYYTNISNVIGNMLGFGVNYLSVKILIATICISYILLKLFSRFIRKITIKKQAVYHTKIIYGSKEADIFALVDTGNTLLDPVSKFPVIIAEFSYIKDFLPIGLQNVFLENKENDLSTLILTIAGTTMEKSIRMIPFKSLGKENGMLIGFKPDRVIIERENARVELSDVIIGIYNLSLSNTGDYQGLLSPEVLEASFSGAVNNL